MSQMCLINNRGEVLGSWWKVLTIIDYDVNYEL